jgi:hypothetical protein
VSGRLNIFQRAMLRWDDIHPYNAAHVLRVAAPLDESRLQASLEATLTAAGLGRLSIAAHERGFEYEATPGEIHIRRLAAGGEAREAVAAEIQAQLNTPFDRRAPFLPFRFFVLPEGGGFFLGLVYFHPAADGEAVMHLLRRLMQSYLGAGATDMALDLYPRRHDRWYRQSPGLLARKFASLWRLMRNMRRSRRTPNPQRSDAQNTVTFFSLTPAELAALARAGKAWNATLNDVFLALLLRSLLRLLARQPPPARRPWLSIGCIVNLRRELGLDGPRTFGLFLGSFFITHRGTAEIALPELLAGVREQTARIKRHRLFLGAPLEMAFARWWLGFLDRERRARFYQKHFPLWAGISNMNLNPLWPDRAGGPVREYFRAVSTGPVTPLVLSLTSFGDTTHVGVSYRSEIYSPADIEVVKRSFLEGVRELAGPSGVPPAALPGVGIPANSAAPGKFPD